VLNKVNVPTLVYNRRRHVISVTAAPVAVAGPTEEAIHGFNVLRWVADGMSYWAISDLNASELNEFVRLYRE
jgi:anti-sigma factor RsiW